MKPVAPLEFNGTDVPSIACAVRPGAVTSTPQASDSGGSLPRTCGASIGPTMIRPSHLASLMPKKGRPHWSTVQTETTRPEASVSSNFPARCAGTASGSDFGTLNLCPSIPPIAPNNNAPIQIIAVFNPRSFRSSLTLNRLDTGDRRSVSLTESGCCNN